MQKRADGRYSKQILAGYKDDGARKIINIYGKTKMEVEKKERDIRTQLDKGFLIDNKKITLEMWADRWLETYKKNCEYNTYKRYKATINNQIKPYFGKYLLAKLNLIDIQETVNQLYEKYSLSTLKKIKITLNQIYKFAIRSQLVYINPASELVIHKKEVTEKVTIPKEHVKLLTEFAKDYKYGTFIITLLYTGMRRGEIFALTWNDVDFKEKTISVNKAVYFKNDKPYLKTPKTRSSIRKIPMLSILEEYLADKASKVTIKGTPIFKTDEGAMYSESGTRRLFLKIICDYNLFLRKRNPRNYKYIRFNMHQFRHTYASMLYYAGVDVKVAQSCLGHSSISTTMDVYTHLDKEHKIFNAEKIEKYVNTCISKNIY